MGDQVFRRSRNKSGVVYASLQIFLETVPRALTTSIRNINSDLLVGEKCNVKIEPAVRYSIRFLR